jgi:hypothetical protein
MNLSPDEAEEALAAIHKMTQKTRHSVASSGAYIFLMITGGIWLAGFLANQFLPAAAVYVWLGTSLAGSALAGLLGARLNRRVRSASTPAYTRRIGLFWGLLILYCMAVLAVVWPVDGKQVTLLIILFIMIGQLAMGLLFSFSATWWALPVTALALAGYFWVPAFFYLWMGVLVGGGMIALGVYIRLRW